MPQVGETRSGQTETVQWDGQRWTPVQHNAAAEGGYHPSLADSEHPIMSMLKGFMSGAATGLPTAARIAQATLPIVTGGASIPAQMAVGVGTQALADLADKAAGDPNAPDTFGGYLAHAASGAVLPAVLGGAGKAYEAVKGSGGLLDTALNIGSHVPGFKTVSRMGKAARALGGAAEEAPVAEEAIGGFAQQPKGPYINRPEGPFRGSVNPEDSWPARDTAWMNKPAPDAGSPRLAGKAPKLESTLDDMLKGLSDESTSTSRLADTPSVRSADRGNMLHNVERNAPYGEGQIVPGPRPTEMPAPSLEGLNAPQTGPVHDAGFYGMETPKGADVSFIEGGPESGRFPVPTRDGQEIPSADDVESLIGNLLPQQPAQAGASEMPASFKALARGDEYWGPGTVTRSGEPAMAGEGGQFLYDPQTPSSYLRDQLRGADNPADKDFLVRAYRQRMNINSRPGAEGPSRYAAPPRP